MSRLERCQEIIYWQIKRREVVVLDANRRWFMR
nr:MAG TPA: hypothetical protein [Caudoviricetes sp.]